MYPDPFENASFSSVLGSHGVIGHRKRSFSKTLSRVDLFGLVEMELFESADVIPSICYISEHAFGSLGITRGQFVYLFSLIEVRVSLSNMEFHNRISNFECNRFSCGRG